MKLFANQHLKPASVLSLLFSTKIHIQYTLRQELFQFIVKETEVPHINHRAASDSNELCSSHHEACSCVLACMCMFCVCTTCSTQQAWTSPCSVCGMHVCISAHSTCKHLDVSVRQKLAVPSANFLSRWWEHVRKPQVSHVTRKVFDNSHAVSALLQVR